MDSPGPQSTAASVLNEISEDHIDFISSYRVLSPRQATSPLVHASPPRPSAAAQALQPVQQAATLGARASEVAPLAATLAALGVTPFSGSATLASTGRRAQRHLLSPGADGRLVCAAPSAGSQRPGRQGFTVFSKPQHLAEVRALGASLRAGNCSAELSRSSSSSSAAVKAGLQPPPDPWLEEFDSERTCLHVHQGTFEECVRPALGLGCSPTLALSSLRSLSLTNCALTPAHVALLPPLPALTHLDLSDNPLTHLGSATAGSAPHTPTPTSPLHPALTWLAFCPALTALRLRGAHLAHTPSFLTRPPLLTLDLSCNALTATEGLACLGGTLHTLDLTCNALAQASLALRPLTALTRLHSLALHPNPATLPPAPTAGSYRAWLIDAMPALGVLDAAPTPPSAQQRSAARERARGALAAVEGQRAARREARRGARQYGSRISVLTGLAEAGEGTLVQLLAQQQLEKEEEEEEEEGRVEQEQQEQQAQGAASSGEGAACTNTQGSPSQPSQPTPTASSSSSSSSDIASTAATTSTGAQRTAAMVGSATSASASASTSATLPPPTPRWRLSSSLMPPRLRTQALAAPVLRGPPMHTQLVQAEEAVVEAQAAREESRREAREREVALGRRARRPAWCWRESGGGGGGGGGGSSRGGAGRGSWEEGGSLLAGEAASKRSVIERALAEVRAAEQAEAQAAQQQQQQQGRAERSSSSSSSSNNSEGLFLLPVGAPGQGFSHLEPQQPAAAAPVLQQQQLDSSARTLATLSALKHLLALSRSTLGSDCTGSNSSSGSGSGSLVAVAQAVEACARETVRVLGRLEGMGAVAAGCKGELLAACMDGVLPGPVLLEGGGGAGGEGGDEEQQEEEAGQLALAALLAFARIHLVFAQRLRRALLGSGGGSSGAEDLPSLCAEVAQAVAVFRGLLASSSVLGGLVGGMLEGD